MSTGGDLRAIALSLPKAAEKAHFDRAAFRVDAPKGKIFVTLAANAQSANLVLTPDQQEMVCAAEPDIFAPVPNKWGEKGWTMMTLAPANLATLRSALTMAWHNAAPNALWPELDKGHTSNEP